MSLSYHLSYRAASRWRPRFFLVPSAHGFLSRLDHEIRFVRDSLCGFGPGTLLLLD